MIGYEKKNVNPKNKKTSDCVIRALTGATGKNYYDVLDELVVIAKKTGYGVLDKKCFEKFLDQNGFVKYKQPRKEWGLKYLVAEIDKLSKSKSIVVSMANHLACVVNGKLIDIWDCRNKTIGNYWVKD